MALADEATRFAYALEVIDAAATDPIARVLELARDHRAGTIVVGRPVGLTGRAGPAVESHEAFVQALRAAAAVAVEEWDERFTTVVAERRLRDAGAKTATRKKVRDAVAAQVMLQGYLDSRHRR